jgi:ABC-type transport system involved in cytochrome c biogenesis ATPase subunit
VSEPTSVLRVQDLHFGWPGHRLFQGLNLHLPPGVSLVTGDDGSGKSTLLRLIAGELTAQGGHLSLDGLRPDQQPQAWRQRVFWIDPQTEVHDAVRAGDYLASLPALYPDFSTEAVADLVEGFALEAHLAKPLYMLSAGSRRKVWLTAVFAAGTPLTLIDQPFAALDGPAMRFLRELLQDVAGHPRRAWLIADHEAPAGVPLASTVRL